MANSKEILENLTFAASRARQLDFFEFMRELERLCPGRPKIGHALRHEDDIVLLSQALFMGFAPSSIRKLSPRTDDPVAEADSPIAKSNGPVVKVEVCFQGLLGPSGPLPLAWTDHVWARTRKIPRAHLVTEGGQARRRENTALFDFINIFNHRFLTFIHRAWAMSRKAVDYDRPDESRFAEYIGSFLGLLDSSQRATLEESENYLFFSGHLSNHVRYPSGLIAMISDFLSAPVELREFHGRWLEMPSEVKSSLGGAGQATMGGGLALGSRFYDCQLTFGLEIGPLPLSLYQRLQSDKDRKDGEQTNLVIALKQMVAFYTHRELFCLATLILAKDEVPQPILGGQGRLGLSLWLYGETPAEDLKDYQISLC